MNDHAVGAACVGGGNYAGARPDALLTIYGAGGDIVGTAHLTKGRMVTQGGAEFCVMPFEANLDKDSDAYQAEFGNSGRVTVDRAGLENIILNMG